MVFNEASWDRAARVIVAVALVLALGFLGSTMASWVTALVVVGAAVLLATGAAGFCPLYWVFGTSTCPMRS